MKLRIVLGLIMAIVGSLIALPALAQQPDVAVFVYYATGRCSRYDFSFDFAGTFEGVATPFPVTLHWEVKQGDTVLDSAGEEFIVPNNGDGLRHGFLDSEFIPGQTYTFIFSLDFTTFSKPIYVERSFVAGSCTEQDQDKGEDSPPVLPPCTIEDGRLDITCEGSGVVAAYAQAREDGCYISIYSKYGRLDNTVVLLLQATPAEIASAQAQGGNALIDTADVVNLTSVSIYWLPETGEFQINAGPNEEGKVYVLNFTGCPATNVYTSNSFQKTE